MLQAENLANYTKAGLMPLEKLEGSIMTRFTLYRSLLCLFQLTPLSMIVPLSRDFRLIRRVPVHPLFLPPVPAHAEDIAHCHDI